LWQLQAGKTREIDNFVNEGKLDLQAAAFDWWRVPEEFISPTYNTVRF